MLPATGNRSVRAVFEPNTSKLFVSAPRDRRKDLIDVVERADLDAEEAGSGTGVFRIVQCDGVGPRFGKRRLQSCIAREAGSAPGPGALQFLGSIEVNDRSQFAPESLCFDVHRDLLTRLARKRGFDNRAAAERSIHRRRQCVDRAAERLVREPIHRDHDRQADAAIGSQMQVPQARWGTLIQHDLKRGLLIGVAGLERLFHVEPQKQPGRFAEVVAVECDRRRTADLESPDTEVAHGRFRSDERRGKKHKYGAAEWSS